jgi:hypothetical protein
MPASITLRLPGFLINGLKREELIAANSMILHELYFAGLSDGSQPGAALADALGRDFGNIDRWRAEFVAMGKAEGGGSAESRSEIGPPDFHISLTSRGREPGDFARPGAAPIARRGGSDRQTLCQKLG